MSNITNTMTEESSWSLPILFSAVAVVAATLWLLAKKKKYPEGVRPLPHLHSWIPYIGSAMELQKGYIRDFITKSAAKLNAPAFTATIMGEKTLFVADSNLVPFIFRDSKERDNMTLQYRFMSNVMQFKPNELIFDHPSYKDIMKLFHTHLLKEEGLHDLLMKVQNILWNDTFGLREGEYELFRLTAPMIFRATTGSLLSKSFLDNDEHLLATFSKFDRVVPLLFIGAPTAIPTVQDGVNALVELTQFFDSETTKTTESKFLQQRREVLTEALESWDVEDVNRIVARGNVSVLLASVFNSTQSVFWTLFHLMEDPKAYQACTDAVDRTVKERGKQKVNHFSLDELDQLPELRSAFQEALRIHQSVFVTREAVQDFVLNPKETNGDKYLVEKGTQIQVYPNTMHMDPLIFENPHEYRYDRFLDPSAKSLQGTLLSSHLRPFGGGKHMCPGRKFIDYEARAFLAMLLHKYEMTLAPGETRPGIDFSRQGLAVCAANRDVKIQVKLRQ